MSHRAVRAACAALSLLVLLASPQAEGAGLDHYMLYKIRNNASGPAFYAFGPVSLADQLGARTCTIVKPIQLGLPADKNGEGVSDPVTHLEEYKISGASPAFTAVAGVRVANQCSDVLVDLRSLASVLVPVNKSLTTPPVPPSPTNPLDHFLCYTARARSVVPRGTQVDVEDQFQTRRYDLKKITKLCNAVAKSGAPVFQAGPSEGSPKPITPATIKNPQDHLVCYRATLSRSRVAQDGCGPATPGGFGTRIVPSQARHAKRIAVKLADQFGPEVVDTVQSAEVCIPSLKDPACGNGLVETLAGEECDDGDTTSEDGCSSQCKEEFCGDGVLQPGLGEQCEPGSDAACPGLCRADCQCGPVREDLTPASPAAIDAWDFAVAAGETVRVRADTVDGATAADLCFLGGCPGGQSFGGDDEGPCAFSPSAFGCPDTTFVAPAAGTCTFYLTLCSPTFAGPATANYELRVTRNGMGAALTLVGDDQ